MPFIGEKEINDWPGFREPQSDVPVSDLAAFNMSRNQPHNILYEKSRVCYRLGQPYATSRKMFQAPFHDAVLRPNLNLIGMGRGAKRMQHQTVLMGYNYDETMIAQPFVDGQHLSIDGLVIEGKVVWSRVTTCRKGAIDFMFDSFHVTCGSAHRRQIAKIEKLLESDLFPYTGAFNVEFIGNTVIDFHLRLTYEFLPIYGAWIIDALDILYSEDDVESKRSKFADLAMSKPKQAWVAPIFLPEAIAVKGVCKWLDIMEPSGFDIYSQPDTVTAFEGSDKYAPIVRLGFVASQKQSITARRLVYEQLSQNLVALEGTNGEIALSLYCHAKYKTGSKPMGHQFRAEDVARKVRGSLCGLGIGLQFDWMDGPISELLRSAKTPVYARQQSKADPADASQIGHF